MKKSILPKFDKKHGDMRASGAKPPPNKIDIVKRDLEKNRARARLKSRGWDLVSKFVETLPEEDAIAVGFALKLSFENWFDPS